MSNPNIYILISFIFVNSLIAHFLWGGESPQNIINNFFISHLSNDSSDLIPQALNSQFDLGEPISITINNFNLQSDFNLLQICPYRKISRNVFEKWIQEQNEISFEGILRNIGDVNWSEDLVKEKHVSLGAVIAGTSTSNPDYFYQWVRDGAITINSIINHLSFFDQFQNKSLQITVENYLKNSFELQRTDNPSGKYDEEELLSLGEPKFLVNSSAFLGSWGRPQNDGPALRIISIDNFLKNLEAFNVSLIQTENFEDLRDVYFKIAKPDLKFIAKYWRNKNFDLWEEVYGHHFFTSLTQLKSLKIGIKLYEKYDNQDPQFIDNLVNAYSSLSKFINSESGFVNYNLNHIVETPSILDQRQGLDTAILIASSLTHDDDDDLIPFDVGEGLVLNTLSELIRVMKYLYPINHNRINLNIGVALGRYPEDVYNGVSSSEGNPWFLTTLSAGEVIFKLIFNLYAQEKDLTIDEYNRNFYFNNILEFNSVLEFQAVNGFDSDQFVIKIPYNSIAFNQTTANLFQFADSFLDVVREHVSDDGSMSEQFNKYTGYMEGAENLTWSYGTFWNAYRWRLKALKFIESK